MNAVSSSRLRGVWIASAVLLCAAACKQPPAREVPPPSPRIVFDQTAFDFGHAEQGNKVTHEFVFHNAGGADLAIDNVRTSCGCTAAVTSAKVIPPGQSGTIRATFDTAHVFGKKRKTVTVYSSDPTHAVTTLLITGEVTVEIAADPPELYVAHVSRGQTADPEVHIVAKDGIVATAVESTSSIIEPKMHEVSGDHGGQAIGVTVKPGAPLGRFNEIMLIKTTSPAHPVLSVPVVGVVVGDVTTSPTQIAFGPVTRNERASQVVVVKNTGKTPVHLSAVHLPSRWAEAKVKSVRDGYEYEVVVRLRAGIPLGRLHGTMEIETDSSEQPRLRLPITGVVRSKK